MTITAICGDRRKSMTNHRRDKHINAIRAYLGVGEDKWGIGVRKHSDGTICKARSRETCPKEHHIEQADRLDETQKVQRFGRKTEKPHFKAVSPKGFVNAITAAKESMPANMRWRVDVKSEDDYTHCKALLVSDGGSCAAVKENGDIVSVCKNITDPVCKGRDLIREAIKHGGDRLDSFDGNWGFYISCGFKRYHGRLSTRNMLLMDGSNPVICLNLSYFSPYQMQSKKIR